MKILITGGAGKLGSHLARALCDADYEVVVVDNLLTGKLEQVPGEAKFVELDIRDEELEAVFRREKPEVVFHCAAQTESEAAVEDPLFDADINVIGSLNVFERAVQFKVTKLIYFSIPLEELRASISPDNVSKHAILGYLKFYRDKMNLDCHVVWLRGEALDAIVQRGLELIFQPQAEIKN